MVISLKSIMEDENSDNSAINQQQIHIFVRNPIIHYTWDRTSHYTSYAIHIETNHIAFGHKRSVVRRRYSEFHYLRSLIKLQHPTIDPPALPPKSYFANKSHDDFIEKRRQGLQLFLQKLMEVPMYVSNRTVHLFAQSVLPMHKVAHLVGCDNDTSDEIEPHLTLNNSFPDEDHLNYETEAPDFDILGRLRGNRASVTSLGAGGAPICCECGHPLGQSLRQGHHRLSLEQPASSSRPRCDTCDGLETDFSEVDSISAAAASNSAAAVIPVRHSNLNVPNSLSDYSVTPDDVHIPKKKVSFCSEVSVAQILNQESD